MGGHVTGRLAIAEGHRHLFETLCRGSQASFTVDKVKSLGDNVATVLTRARLTFIKDGVPASYVARPSFVARRAVSEWRIDMFQNTIIAGTESRDTADELLAEHPHRQRRQA